MLHFVMKPLFCRNLGTV